MSTTEEPNATLRGSGSNDQLGLPPAYLGDGQTAYAAGIVASWPEHNRARFCTLLFTGEQLERAVAAERERWALLLRAAGRVLQAFDDGSLQPDPETLQGGIAVDALREAWGAFAPARIRGPNAELTGAPLGVAAAR